MAIYDNQPSAERVREKLKQDGWSQSRIDAAELATFVGDRKSKRSGKGYEVMLLAVVESGTLTAAFAQAQSGRIYADKDKATLRRHTHNTFTDSEAGKAQAISQADRESLLNDLTEAMCDGLKTYPRGGVLEYFERKGTGKLQIRIPSSKGIEYLVEQGIPLAFNPMHEGTWIDEDQTRLETIFAAQETVQSEATDEPKQTDDAPESAPETPDISSRFLLVKDVLESVGKGDLNDNAKGLFTKILGSWIATGIWDEKQNGPCPETWEKPIAKIETEDLDEKPDDSKPVHIKDLKEGEDATDVEPQVDQDDLDLASSILTDDDTEAEDIQESFPLDDVKEPELELEPVVARPARRGISVEDE